MLHFYILTACPEIYPGILGTSLAGKALGQIWSYTLVNIRDFGIGPHRKIDDAPYGGGPGLVIRPDVLMPAIDSIISKISIDCAYYLAASGLRLNQFMIKEMAKSRNILMLCGRFEGIDQRVVKRYNLIEISIGDYVLSNGDLAALVIMDSLIRLQPGVMGNQESYTNDSFFEDFNCDYPVYTRPQQYSGMDIPEVLMSGNHAEISKWRRQAQSERLSLRTPQQYKTHDNKS